MIGVGLLVAAIAVLVALLAVAAVTDNRRPPPRLHSIEHAFNLAMVCAICTLVSMAAVTYLAVIR